MRKIRVWKVLGYGVLLLMAWLVFVAVRIWTFGNTDHATKSDCVIVLGAAAYGTKPSPVFEERIRHAIDLYRAGLASKIIFTGGYGERAPVAESTVGANFAIRAGIPAADILTETKSHTTRENLGEAKTLMDAASLHTAILVSDPLHLKRSATMAEDLGMTAVTSPTPTSRYRSFGVKWSFLCREVYFYHHFLVGDQ